MELLKSNMWITFITFQMKHSLILNVMLIETFVTRILRSIVQWMGYSCKYGEEGGPGNNSSLHILIQSGRLASLSTEWKLRFLALPWETWIHINIIRPPGSGSHRCQQTESFDSRLCHGKHGYTIIRPPDSGSHRCQQAESFDSWLCHGKHGYILIKLGPLAQGHIVANRLKASIPGSAMGNMDTHKSVFQHTVISEAEVPAICSLVFSRGPPIFSDTQYGIQCKFLCYRIFILKPLMSEKVKPRIKKKRKRMGKEKKY